MLYLLGVGKWFSRKKMTILIKKYQRSRDLVSKLKQIMIANNPGQGISFVRNIYRLVIIIGDT